MGGWWWCWGGWALLGGYKTLSDEWAERQQFALHRPTDRSGERRRGGGGYYQIDDATLPSSQAECDPHRIAPLLFLEGSEGPAGRY